MSDGRKTHRRTRAALAISGLALMATMGVASPASAHPGHGSCGQGAREYVVALAHSGNGGAFASSLAKEGLIDDNVAAAHAVYCEPRP